MATEKFDVIVIGSGPGGYVAAIRCSQLGLKTAVVEKEKLGGVCLNVGCIPSKAMITASHFYHRAQHEASEMGFDGSFRLDMPRLKKWKDSVCDKMSGGVSQLLKGNGVHILSGQARFKSATEIEIKAGSGGVQLASAKNFILANGSRPLEIPGFKIDEKNVLSSTGALDLTELPKRVVVIGGGYIGLEIGTFLRKLGCEVRILEATDSLLKGAADPDCVAVVAKKLKKLGLNVHLEAKALGYSSKAQSLEVSFEEKGKAQKVECDKILCMVGRRANGDEMGIKEIGIKVTERGFVEVNSQRRTNLHHIFAIGDVAGQPMLAHKASYEGILVAEVLAGQNRAYDAKVVPAVVFVDPEIASVGMTEEDCKKAGIGAFKIGKFPFAANGRAVSMMETEGFVKIIARADNHVVLGVHIVGPEASNLISEAALAVEMGARLEDLALTIHPHPTLGETMMEAAEAALGHAIHIIQRPLHTRPGNGSARIST